MQEGMLTDLKTEIKKANACVDHMLHTIDRNRNTKTMSEVFSMYGHPLVTSICNMIKLIAAGESKRKFKLLSRIVNHIQ